jgi:hypothetical protein
MGAVLSQLIASSRVPRSLIVPRTIVRANYSSADMGETNSEPHSGLAWWPGTSSPWTAHIRPRVVLPIRMPEGIGEIAPRDQGCPDIDALQAGPVLGHGPVFHGGRKDTLGRYRRRRRGAQCMSLQPLHCSYRIRAKSGLKARHLSITIVRQTRPLAPRRAPAPYVPKGESDQTISHHS